MIYIILNLKLRTLFKKVYLLVFFILICIITFSQSSALNYKVIIAKRIKSDSIIKLEISNNLDSSVYILYSKHEDYLNQKKLYLPVYINENDKQVYTFWWSYLNSGMDLEVKLYNYFLIKPKSSISIDLLLKAKKFTKRKVVKFEYFTMDKLQDIELEKAMKDEMWYKDYNLKLYEMPLN